MSGESYRQHYEEAHEMQERLTRVEEQVRSLANSQETLLKAVESLRDERERVVRLEMRIASLIESQTEMAASFSALKLELSRYKGFVGGVAFLGSAVAGLVVWLAKSAVAK